MRDLTAPLPLSPPLPSPRLPEVKGRRKAWRVARRGGRARSIGERCRPSRCLSLTRVRARTHRRRPHVRRTTEVCVCVWCSNQPSKIPSWRRGVCRRRAPQGRPFSVCLPCCSTSPTPRRFVSWSPGCAGLCRRAACTKVTKMPTAVGSARRGSVALFDPRGPPCSTPPSRPGPATAACMHLRLSGVTAAAAERVRLNKPETVEGEGAARRTPVAIQ